MNKNLFRCGFTAFCIVILMIVANGCSSTSQIKQEEKEKISDLVMPKIDSMMQGFLDGNYSIFSAAFDEKMRSGMPESSFFDTQKMITEKIGSYQSFVITDIMETQNYVTVICSAVFENEGKVTIRIIFNPKEDYSVSGIWFDSPELRK